MPDSKVYFRTIYGVDNSTGDAVELSIDVYQIAGAFKCTPALAHALKKILVPGERGAKSREQDLLEAIDSIHRQIEIDRAQEEAQKFYIESQTA